MRATKNIETICLLLLSLATVSTTLAADAASGKPKRPYLIGIPVLENEKAMKEWVQENLSPSRVLDFERGGRKVCVALHTVGSGRLTTTVYIFITEPRSGTWGIASIWQTYTSEVRITLSKNEKQLIFRSKSGKLLFRAPFETLEPKDHPDF